MIKELILEILTRDGPETKEKIISLLELLLEDDKTLSSCQTDEILYLLFLINKENNYNMKYLQLLSDELFLNLLRKFLGKKDNIKTEDNKNKEIVNSFPDFFDKIEGKLKVKDESFNNSSFVIREDDGRIEHKFFVDKNGFVINHFVHEKPIDESNIDYTEIYADLSDDILKYQSEGE